MIENADRKDLNLWPALTHNSLCTDFFHIRLVIQACCVKPRITNDIVFIQSLFKQTKSSARLLFMITCNVLVENFVNGSFIVDFCKYFISS